MGHLHESVLGSDFRYTDLNSSKTSNALAYDIMSVYNHFSLRHLFDHSEVCYDLIKFTQTILKIKEERGEMKVTKADEWKYQTLINL